MSRHILIIDDDEATMRMVGQLAPTELPFRSVPTAEEGLARAAEEPPALIVLSADIAGGFRACRQLKKDRKLRPIPLILVSGEATHDQFKEHARLPTRAEMYIHKPIDGVILVKAFRKYLRESTGEFGIPPELPPEAAEAPEPPRAPAPPPPPAINSDEDRAALKSALTELETVTRERDALRDEVAALKGRVSSLKETHQRVEAGFDHERRRLKERIDELSEALAAAQNGDSSAPPAGSENLQRELRLYKHLYADLVDGMTTIREALRVPLDILGQHGQLRSEAGLPPMTEDTVEPDVDHPAADESSASFDQLAHVFDDSEVA